MTAQAYYLGPPGTFGEQAAIRFLAKRGLQTSLHPLTSHPAVIAAVDADARAIGVVAVENSLDGAVRETVDAMLSAGNVQVCGELDLPVEHHLITAPGRRLEDLNVVMSHSSALAQCRSFLEAHLPKVRLDAALSTAGAVEQALKTPGAAGIGPSRAAEVYGGVILARSIQDDTHNQTRFFLLARQDAPPTGDDKTSIAFSVPNQPGSLVRAMRHLSDRGLNLTRIESRPSRAELGAYVFLIDFQGHRSDAPVRDALDALVADGAALLPAGRPLGSYPRFHA